MKVLDRKLPVIVCLLLGFEVWASTMISVQGKIVQIKDGNVEIKNSSGLSKIVLKTLPKESQDAIARAMLRHQEIQLSFTPEMVAPE